MSKFKVGDVVKYIGTDDDKPSLHIAKFISENTLVGIVTKVDISIGSMREDSFTSDELEKDWTFYDVQFAPEKSKSTVLGFISSKNLDFVTIGEVKESHAVRNDYYPFFDNDYEWYKKNWPELIEALEKQVVPLEVLPQWILYTKEEIDAMVPKTIGGLTLPTLHTKVYYRLDKSGNNDKLFFEGDLKIMFVKFHPSENGYVYRRGLVSVFLPKENFPADENLAYQGRRFLDTLDGDELILQYLTDKHLHGNGQLKEEYTSRNPFTVEFYKENPEFNNEKK